MTKPSSPAAPMPSPPRPRWWQRLVDGLRRAPGPSESALLARFPLDADAADALARAFREARGVVTIADYLWALARGPLQPLLDATGTSPTLFKPPRADGAPAARADFRFAGLLAFAEAHAAAAGRASLSGAHIFVALYRYDRGFARFLEDQLGIDLVSAMTFASHGVVEHPRYDDASAPAGEELEIVVHNDDFTPQDVVVELLMQALGVDPSKASELMFLIHDSEAQEVAVMPRAEAIELVNEMLRAAREAGVPLKITLR